MSETLDGACACGHVRFHLSGAPIVTHACHCLQCQRETGSAFAVNLMVEADRLSLDAGAPERTAADAAACPKCGTRLWAYHRMFGEKAVFVKAGVLEAPPAPQVHCFTSTKQPWLALPADAPAYAENYDYEAVLDAGQRSRAMALFA